MLILITDGTYEGLLTAIFEAYSIRPWPDEILLAPPPQQNMLDEYIAISTDSAKAERLQKGITKLSSETEQHINMVFASARDNAGTLIYKYVRAVFSIGSLANSYLTHPDILPVHNLSRRVGKEIHFFTGITRFRSTKQGVFYASINPDSNIVPHLAPHFCERLDMPFVLHDVRHKTAALCKDGEYIIVPADLSSSDFDSDEEQELFGALWRMFYNSVAIKSRINPKLRMQNMPKKHHVHLTELMPQD